ncbi:MAG TPA: FGGY family carbohydrate kinase [Puia sp.]|jgi:sugar (pentulose or hexulose) kinase|nr:FGGY family carbohydrate kinase [Puia sp.]
MKISVVAIFDIGKTNKKCFLFDEEYKIVFEKNECFPELTDEDGDACEDLQKLTSFIFQSLDEIFSKNEFDVKAINFSAYGASFVYIDENGKTLTPLYNYLKKYPAQLQKKFYNEYRGENEFSLETASPVSGSLNSGMQLYRIKNEKPEIFSHIKYALHLPQYISYLISKIPLSDITSIGCHTNLWSFEKNQYHEWVEKEDIENILAPIVSSGTINTVSYKEKNIAVGVGLHDSSAALIPYLKYFDEPFVLLSTGTWCISLNPFNDSPLTAEQLQNDSLCYLTHEGKQVKASRLFAGYEHEQQTKKISAFFSKPVNYYNTIKFNEPFINPVFSEYNLSSCQSYEEAYHQFMRFLVKKQFDSTQLILEGSPVKRIFVDGGFSKNDVYMNLLAHIFPGMEVFAASIPQASAIGAAMIIHNSWNKKRMPERIIELKKYE